MSFSDFIQWGLAIVTMQDITVAYDKKETSQLAGALFLGDAISDLPPVSIFPKYFVKLV